MFIADKSGLYVEGDGRLGSHKEHHIYESQVSHLFTFDFNTQFEPYFNIRLIDNLNIQRNDIRIYNKMKKKLSTRSFVTCPSVHNMYSPLSKTCKANKIEYSIIH